MLPFGNKIFVFAIAICLSIFFYFKINAVNFHYKEEFLNIFNENQYKFIAHAGGGIDEYTYTNSVEAVKLSIDNGYKLIEIDLRETKDNHFVAVNTWEKFKRDSLFKEDDINNEPLTLEEFKKIKIFKKYTPITADAINEIFSKNKDLILVTDKTNNFKKILNDFKFDKNRIIVEIFGRKNYFKSIKKGILNPMFSASHEDYDFIIKNKIKLISAHTENIIKNKNIYKKLIDSGVKIFAYSSNEEKFIKDNIDIYFTGVYTEFWDISQLKCISSKCVTY